MTNKVALSLIAAAAFLTSCAGPSATEPAATPATGGDTTAAEAAAPADPGGHWLGGDADKDWGSGGGGSTAGGRASEKTASYAAEDATALAAVPAPSGAGVAAEHVTGVYETLERPMPHVLARME